MGLLRMFRALFALVLLTAVWLVGLVMGVAVVIAIVLGLSSPEGRQKLDEFRDSLQKMWTGVKEQLAQSSHPIEAPPSAESGERAEL